MTTQGGAIAMMGSTSSDHIVSIRLVFTAQSMKSSASSVHVRCTALCVTASGLLVAVARWRSAVRTLASRCGCPMTTTLPVVVLPCRATTACARSSGVAGVAQYKQTSRARARGDRGKALLLLLSYHRPLGPEGMWGLRRWHGSGVLLKHRTVARTWTPALCLLVFVWPCCLDNPVVWPGRTGAP